MEKQIETEEKPIPLSQLNWKDYLVRKNYNTDINKMCSICQGEQLKKFGNITIRCSGLATIPQKVLDQVSGNLNKEEMNLIEEMYNPYYWASQNIKESAFKHRWYQEFMTRCTSTKSIYRCGRRSGKSKGFAIKALHKIFLNENTKILMLAPAESQVKEFDEIIKTLVSGFKEDFMNPDSFLLSSRKKPYYEIDFSNGSKFRGMVAANDAKTVRSQGAGVNVIILDEVDFIPDDALTAVMGVLLDNPNVELWVSSTPSGKAKLYSLENSKQYKTFHFPSFVIPHMTDELEQELRTQYGWGVKWIHEVLAEYGDDEEGVFQSFFIDKCIVNQGLEAKRADVLINRDNYMVILGVDWNDDKVGTRLMSVAFDRKEKKFFNANQETVSKDGWTQVAAVEKLIQLNREYKYDQIYLDEGFGVSTIQFIKKFALDQYGKLPANHPDLKLANVQGINFSSNIEINDIETNAVIKKDMKSYIVENSTRYLERLGFMFDKEYDHDLIEQMEDYRILRRSPSGKAVYGSRRPQESGDHDLDAWMLALLGFNLEYRDVSKTIDARAMIATIPREASSNIVDFTRFLADEANKKTPISKFNNLYTTRMKNTDPVKKGAEFYDRYIKNGEYSNKTGIMRSGMRSKLKESAGISTGNSNNKEYLL
jgi:hypothetical protein